MQRWFWNLPFTPSTWSLGCENGTLRNFPRKVLWIPFVSRSFASKSVEIWPRNLTDLAMFWVPWTTTIWRLNIGSVRAVMLIWLQQIAKGITRSFFHLNNYIPHISYSKHFKNPTPRWTTTGSIACVQNYHRLSMFKDNVYGLWPCHFWRAINIFFRPCTTIDLVAKVQGDCTSGFWHWWKKALGSVSRSSWSCLDLIWQGISSTGIAATHEDSGSFWSAPIGWITNHRVSVQVVGVGVWKSMTC